MTKNFCLYIGLFIKLLIKIGDIMKNKFAKLIDVKSLVTLVLTLLFCVMSFKGNIPQEVQNIYLMIIAFYFGTQHEKNKSEE